jgi:hypothetical protein
MINHRLVFTAVPQVRELLIITRNRVAGGSAGFSSRRRPQTPVVAVRYEHFLAQRPHMLDMPPVAFMMQSTCAAPQVGLHQCHWHGVHKSIELHPCTDLTIFQLLHPARSLKPIKASHVHRETLFILRVYRLAEVLENDLGNLVHLRVLPPCPAQLPFTSRPLPSFLKTASARMVAACFIHAFLMSTASETRVASASRGGRSTARAWRLHGGRTNGRRKVGARA